MQVVGYKRVSTQEQGDSRNGLDGQEAAIQAFCATNRLTLVSTHSEVASGAVCPSARPVLQAAFGEADRLGATVVVSKLDRLSRDASDVLLMMKNRVRFITAEDGLDVDPMMLHMKAVFAEKERIMIGQRTKAALAALSARGVLLGCAQHKDPAATRAKMKASALVTMAAKADAFASRVVPMLTAMVSTGMTYAQVADALNSAKTPTARGGKWNATTVCRVLKRANTA